MNHTPHKHCLQLPYPNKPLWVPVRVRVQSGVTWHSGLKNKCKGTLTNKMELDYNKNVKETCRHIRG